MKQFEYVNKKEWGPVRDDLFELIRLVQDEVRKYFTFRFDPIGSASRNMITREVNGNTGYDFDINIRVNDPDEKFSAEEIRAILKRGFDKYARRFSYDYTEDSTRVLTIKVKDTKHSRILHSCDFAVVYDCNDGSQQYIRYIKNEKRYDWEWQPEPYYLLKEKEQQIKKFPEYWNEVRNLYLYLKCNNNDPNKKSRHIYVETINDVFNQYFR